VTTGQPEPELRVNQQQSLATWTITRISGT
jgi:hypothetical protein